MYLALCPNCASKGLPECPTCLRGEALEFWQDFAKLKMGEPSEERANFSYNRVEPVSDDYLSVELSHQGHFLGLIHVQCGANPDRASAQSQRMAISVSFSAAPKFRKGIEFASMAAYVRGQEDFESGIFRLRHSPSMGDLSYLEYVCGTDLNARGWYRHVPSLNRNARKDIVRRLLATFWEGHDEILVDSCDVSFLLNYYMHTRLLFNLIDGRPDLRSGIVKSISDLIKEWERTEILRRMDHDFGERYNR